MVSTAIRLAESLTRATARRRDDASNETATLSDHPYQYPGMMVPAAQRRIHQALTSILGTGRLLFDPFVGSGMTLTEAMASGQGFVGVDTNPLAILICRTKAQPLRESVATKTFQDVIARARSDRSSRIETDFPNVHKWFEHDTSVALSRIARSIRCQSDRTRPFCWLALAETARIVSNSRSSTFKLHVMTRKAIASRRIDALTVFEEVANRNAHITGLHRDQLKNQGLLTSSGRYSEQLSLILGDSRLAPWPQGKWANALITSPPYGDNLSTVTYGQASYLPLQWVDQGDLKFDKALLCSTRAIDSLSIGGSRVNAINRVSLLFPRSPTLESCVTELYSECPPDRAIRVASYFADLDVALNRSLKVVRPGAPIVITIGNRMVGNRRIPTDQIVRDLIESQGAIYIEGIKRQIPRHKTRHPSRNSISSTIGLESTLIFETRVAGSDQAVNGPSKSIDS